MRLSYSGRVAHQAFLTQGQEACLEGHVYALERLGGVPVDKVRYDNLNSAVKQVLFAPALPPTTTLRPRTERRRREGRSPRHTSPP